MSNNKEYDNTNRGTLFRNYDKEKMKREKDTSKWANAQGTLNVFGMEFYMNAWTNTIKKGDHKGDIMQQITITPKDEKEGVKLESAIKRILNGSYNDTSKPEQGSKSSADIDETFDDMDDDLPF